MAKGSTNTHHTSDVLDSALAGIPRAFRTRIVAQYLDVRAAFASGDHDATGLRSGVFAEIVLRLLQELLTGGHTPFGSRLGPFDTECLKLQNLPQASGHESLRIVIPRALVILYTLRNKRGIGHVGGDVEANSIDAALCARLCDWCICELLRLYHGLSLEDAQSLLDTIAVRECPSVWSVNGRRRILNPTLDYKSQALLLLYSEPQGSVLEEDLQDWIEYSGTAKFRSRILSPLHRSRLIEWDRETGTVTLSPSGSREVEERLLPSRIQ